MATDTISFARGAPSADILPVEAVREATARSLESDWERALSYGTGIGHPGLCEWVGREFHGVGAERVMFTNGSMEAAALLFRYMVEPGDRVIVEQPSYDRTLLLLGRTGAEIVGVPLEADGIQLEAFEAALADGPVKLAHVIPNFHNPAGCTLSAAKRERLVELAGEHGFWIFEDDPYRLIRFGDADLPPTMLSQDTEGRVIHASSFSKTVSPGIRVGYLAGPADEIKVLAKRANETYIS
ncbi:MAG: PLP-dependent aminotransferase family protein, partial [Solirubrobacterales bacterium]